MRRGPKDGYDFARKRDYRRRVWATFRDSLKKRGLSVAESHAMLMPSLEGDEIDVALSAGFREQHLHVVDEEPAVVAMLKRRYPKIQTYGVKAWRAMGRLMQSGIRIRCANFDFCSQFSLSLLEELAVIAMVGSFPTRATMRDHRIEFNESENRTGVFEDISFVAVSVLRGRESKAVTDSWDGLKDESVKSSWHFVRASFSDVQQSTIDASGAHSLHQRLLQLPDLDRHRLARVLASLKLANIPGVDARVKPIIDFVRAETYPSINGQTMLWSIWCIESINYAASVAFAADQKRARLGLPLKRHLYPGLQAFWAERRAALTIGGNA